MTRNRLHRNVRGLLVGLFLGAMAGALFGGFTGNRLVAAILGAAILGAALYRVNPGRE
ncbi:MAG: glycine zipper domain [Micrococcaceae bacterium]|jgi:uncharacterized membrane protein YfcA|nr:glycine zipper domain [Micrococcaceae bacterium]